MWGQQRLRKEAVMGSQESVRKRRGEKKFEGNRGEERS